MKRIKTVNGMISFDVKGETFILERAKEILTDHRATLIKRLLAGLEDYVVYKFSMRPTPLQLSQIKETLMHYKDSSVDLDDLPDVKADVITKDLTVVPNKPFYDEIDNSILNCLTT